MNISKYVIILFIISNISVFGQSYSGPATGSVSGGVQVSTNNFPSAPIGNDDLKDKREIPLMKYESQHEYYDTEGEVVDNYTYVEDKNTHSKNFGDTGTSFELHSFPSIGQAGSVPGDPHMAVGPNHVVTTANSRFAIYDRDGNLLKIIAADAWCSAVVGFPGTFDPQIIYDHYAGRWFMLWDSQNSGNLTAWFIISYSDDEDPIGTWYMYALDATVNGTTEANNWGDYPQLGYDDQGIYISSRQFDFSGNPNFQYSKIRILNKAELYAANTGPVSWTDLWNIRLPNGQNQDDLHPTISYDPGNNTAYFFWVTDSWNGALNYYVLYKITDPISSPVLTGVSLPVPTYYAAPHGQQLGTAELIDAGAFGSGMRNAPILRDGKIYGVHHIRNTQFPANASIKYFVVDISSNSVLEQVEYGAQGFWYLYPAITVDKDHNIAITYSRTAATEYVGAFYSTRLSTDPPGFSDSKVMQAGSGSITFNRWGDYLSAALDPINQYDIWLYSEYANMTSWGTWVTEVRMKLYPGAHAYPVPKSIDFKDVETGTESQTASIILINYGDADLVISNIPSSFDNYNLVSTLSFPVTVASYDSLTLEFTFSPTSAGSSSVLYPVTSNDPDFDGLQLSGLGYDLVIATEKTFYGSSGLQNSGNILTIDPVTGAGTIVGASSFNEVTSISINPVDGKIYGLAAGISSSQLLKINSADGDAHVYFNINIPQMASIAFDTTGVLYGITRTGDLYTIEITNGSTSFVVDATGSYLSITFHPETNELWATSRAAFGVNLDAIFTVNLSTGDTTIIGHTVLGKQTNAITFDENLKLFGVIGTSTEINDFVSINTTNGVGSIIGSVGFKHILGLAYVDQILTSVEGDNNETIPSDYTLKQNYPNPFNPTTKIDFSLPVESDVKLIIYNILGQEVIQLINNQMSAGNHSIIWNANDAAGNQLTSGIYLYKLTATGTNGNEFQEIKKMILLK